MRAHFGLHFFGQVGTFVYLTHAMRLAPEFDVAAWPQLSVYNLLVANFWPLYWLAYFIDPLRLNKAYWHVFEVAAARAGEVYRLIQFALG